MVFPLLMVSCSRGGKELAAKLHLADSLIEAEPDSGVALLVSLREQAEDASKANRYRYQLLLAKAKNQAYVPITTDSILEEVAGYYDDHGSANQKMMAHYLLGCAYRDMGDLPQACCSMRRPSPRPTPPARTATSRRWEESMGRRLASYGSSISP